MAFIETPQFPPLISFGAIGGPGFMTDIVVVNSGQEYRNQVRALELGSWEVSHAARRPVNYRLLQAFFRIAAGRVNGFRFKDWTDFAATSSEGVFTLLTSTTFQMYKRYTSGATTHDRKIQKPITPATITGGTVSSVNYATGIVTMSSGTPTSWSGEFDVPCRFDTDEMKAETIDKEGAEFVVGWSSIPVREIRV